MSHEIHESPGATRRQDEIRTNVKHKSSLWPPKGFDYPAMSKVWGRGEETWANGQARGREQEATRTRPHRKAHRRQRAVDTRQIRKRSRVNPRVSKWQKQPWQRSGRGATTSDDDPQIVRAFTTNQKTSQGGLPYREEGVGKRKDNVV